MLWYHRHWQTCPVVPVQAPVRAAYSFLVAWKLQGCTDRERRSISSGAARLTARFHNLRGDLMEGKAQHWSNRLSSLICWTFLLFVCLFFNNRELAENHDLERRSAKDVSVCQKQICYLLLLVFLNVICNCDFGSQTNLTRVSAPRRHRLYFHGPFFLLDAHEENLNETPTVLLLQDYWCNDQFGFFRRADWGCGY